MKPLLFCLLLAVAWAWTGCDSDSSRTDLDVFQIALFDEGGEAAFDGVLRLRIEDAGDDPREVTGTWQLEAAAPPPPSASGSVSGTLFGNEMEVVLDVQNQSDTGFELLGTYDGDRFAGTWSTLTIAGPQPGGTFEAVRQ